MQPIAHGSPNRRKQVKFLDPGDVIVVEGQKYGVDRVAVHFDLNRIDVMILDGRVIQFFGKRQLVAVTEDERISAEWGSRQSVEEPCEHCRITRIN